MDRRETMSARAGMWASELEPHLGSPNSPSDHFFQQHIQDQIPWPNSAIVIDFKENGNFFVYSDPEVEVICREVHMPDDELYRFGPIRSPRSG